MEIVTSVLTVYLVVSGACPLSNRYQPEFEKLRAEYQPRGVRFEQVSTDTAEGLRTASRLGARVTPQAVVTGSRGSAVYRGRIDDRMPALGVHRRPTRHDLREAIEALLAGKSPPVRETTAIGCAIAYPPAKATTGVTFARHAAPLLYRHCTPCHHTGGDAPFALESFGDAAPRAAVIAEVVRRGLMPPWKADPGPLEFEGAHRLTGGEIRLLESWARDGAPRGDPGIEPAAPKFQPGWKLGAPDRTVRMQKPVEVPATGEDIYTCVVIPLGLKQTGYVRAFEFKPGNRRTVHHALMFLDASGAARRNGEVYPCFGVPGFLPSASLGGWTPGFGPTSYPPLTAVTLRPGMDLVLQLHYHPTGTIETDQSELALYFTETAPTRRMMDVALGSRNIDIPAGEARYIVRDHFTLPVPVEVTGIIPHAHYICREMRGTAIRPDGRRIPLITVRGWDFNWQRHYRYKHPFTLPAGTRIEMEFLYDNSAANPRNPSNPPRRVTWGGGSLDEMAGLHVQVIPANDDDARELGQSLWGKIMRELGGGILKR